MGSVLLHAKDLLKQSDVAIEVIIESMGSVLLHAKDLLKQFDVAVEVIIESMGSVLLHAKDLLKQFDVAVEVIVDLGRCKRRRYPFEQAWRIGRRIDAIWNAPERTEYLLTFLREHEIDK